MLLKHIMKYLELKQNLRNNEIDLKDKIQMISNALEEAS